ncbi:MAG: efflux RND transporter permease subunit [Deltaproteobacteria bacterium]|nr:efflux RND transporter permease subunit [Deltaproteobacteria bacterium]
MSLSSPFVHRPVATALLALAVLLGGAAAYTQLPVSPLPRVDFPTLSVSAALPGASPEIMASAVATPLERRLGRIPGVAEMTSSSSLGSTSITLQFDLDRDVADASRDVQAAINAALGELPPGLPNRPSFRNFNPSDAPVMIVSLTSDEVPLPRLFDEANTVLAQRISRVEGVGQVMVGGGQQPAVRVQADPVALAGVGLSLEDVRTALARATVDQATGSVSGATRSLAIEPNDQLFGAAAFEPLVLAWRDGGAVRLRDVARVLDDVENNRAAAWADGHRAVVLIIRKEPGANVIDVIARVRALLPTLTAAISPSIQVEVAVDRATTIRASVREVEESLLISVALVVLVVFAFLRSARATLIPSVAVPLSLVGTFGLMHLLGYSLNNLSLMALTVSTGFVVDDAIVVTENIARYIEEGDGPVEAALKGAKQIGFTIVSITVSLLAVFIPILLMGGIVGRLFREFAVTLSVAIALSAVVSLTVTPAMCARLLRSEAGHDHGWLYRASERGFNAMLGAYESGLDLVLRHRRITLLVTLCAVALTGYLGYVIPKGLFPQQDSGQLNGSAEAPQDVSFLTARGRLERVARAVLVDPDVHHSVAFIGGGGGARGSSGSLFVQLRAKPARTASADEVIARLRRTLGRVQGITVYLQSVQDVRIGGRASRTQYQYTLEDANLDELRVWAPRLLTALRGVRELRDVATDQENSGLSLAIEVDRDTAARLGVSMQAVDETLADAFAQRQVAVTHTELNHYRVILEAPASMQQGPESIERVYVRGRGAALVPLGAIVRATPGVLPLSVNHQGQFPAVTLSFNLAPGVSLGQAVDAIAAAERRIGMPAGVRASFRGTAQAFQASLKTQPMLILAALIAVYLVLGMLYESLVHPITILSTLPSAGVGALAALLLTGTEFSVIALVGVVLLIGIVKKNAIMMIDFALEAERTEGLTAEASIRKACLLRFRPIMMTTMAALLGALPLALGTGTGAELRRPLGIAIVGGLLVSQMLTLFTTPVIYLALDRFTRRRKAPMEGGTSAVGEDLIDGPRGQ